jgi:hypothetical protein
MRLIFVHGINNQGKSEGQIIDEWLGALSHSLSPSENQVLRGADIAAPYYGDALYAATQRESEAGPQPVSQSIAETPGEEADFYRDALEDITPAAGAMESDIVAECASDAPVEQGFPHDRRLLALIRVLERISPFHGQVALSFLPQAFVYLRRLSAAEEVDKIVKPALTSGPCIVVAHSLGTIVTFKLLRSQPAASVPFYLTLGSPLAIRAVKNAIGPVFARPNKVSMWRNAFDPNDAVALGRALDTNTFGPGIENIGDIANGADDPHDIRMYLKDRRVAEELARAVARGQLSSG